VCTSVRECAYSGRVRVRFRVCQCAQVCVSVHMVGRCVCSDMCVSVCKCAYSDRVRVCFGACQLGACQVCVSVYMAGGCAYL